MSGVSSTKGKSAALAKTDLVEPFAHRTVMKRPVLSASGEDEAMKNVNLPKEGAPTNAKGRLNEGDLEKALQSADLLQCDDVTPLKDGTAHQESCTCERGTKQKRGILRCSYRNTSAALVSISLWHIFFLLRLFLQKL